MDLALTLHMAPYVDAVTVGPRA